jgi:hypothetical protein
MSEFKPGDKVITASMGHQVGTVKKILVEIEFEGGTRDFWGMVTTRRKVVVAEPFVYKADGSCKAPLQIHGKTVACDLVIGHPKKHHAIVDADIEVHFGTGT